MSDPEQRLFDLLETAERHQKIITEAMVALEAAVTAQAGTRDELKGLPAQVTTAAMRGAHVGSARVPWQRFLMLAACSAGLILAVWLAAWGAAGWQRHEWGVLAEQKAALQADLVTMQGEG